jgi:TonB family protein
MRLEPNLGCVVKALVRVGVAALAGAVLPAAAELRVSAAQAMQAVVKKQTPEYSQLARQMRIEGEVEVEVWISDKGDVEEVKVLKGNSMLTPNVVKAVKGWKFTPFVQDGKAQPAVAPLRFSFKL